MDLINAEALGLMAMALDRDGPDEAPNMSLGGPGIQSGGHRLGDSWLMSELARRIGSGGQDGRDPSVAELALAHRLAHRVQSDLKQVLCCPEPGGQTMAGHLISGDDEVLSALTRTMTHALGLRPQVVAVVAAMILRDTGQTTFAGICARWQRPSGPQGPD